MRIATGLIFSPVTSASTEDRVAQLEKQVATLSDELTKLLEVVAIDAIGNVAIKARTNLILKSSCMLEISAANILQLKGAKIDIN